MDTATFAGVAGATAGLVATAVTVGAMIARPIRKLSRDNDEFRDDWYGRPARPGVPPQPGVMERLARIEASSTDRALTMRVEAVERRLDDHVHSAAQSAV